MPNIVEYNAQGEITPSDKGIQAAEVAGRRIGAFGNQINQSLTAIGNQVEQHMSVMETSELYKTGTQLKLGLQQKYDQESALPENRNDPHFGDRFMAEVGPQLDGWGAGVHTSRGKEVAETLKANIRNDIFSHVAAGQSAMDTAHVEDNLTQTINSLGAGVLQNPTEGNLTQTIGTAKDAIQGMTMNIPDVATRERVASEITARSLPQIVVARYQGVAEAIKQQVAQSGDAAQSPAYDQMGKDIAKQLGFQYLAPETQQRLSEVRDAAVRQGQEMYKAGQAQQNKAQDEEFNKGLTQVQMSMVRPDGSILPAPGTYDALSQLQRMPAAARHPGELKALADMMATAQKNNIDHTFQKTDPTTYTALASRVGKPATAGGLTAADVNTAYAAGRLSNEDFGKLHEMVEKSAADPTEKEMAKSQQEFLTSIKGSFGSENPLTGQFVKPESAQRFYQFQADAQAAIDAARRAGATPMDIQKTLLNPRDPNFLGRRVSLYAVTTKEGMANLAATAAQATGTKGGPPAPSFAPPTLGQVEGAAGPPDAATAKANFDKLTPDMQAWLKARRAKGQ